MESKKYCVIMAGGIGTRFWPKSRQAMPKQFLDILGTGKSFIRQTYERFAPMIPAGNFLVVTNHLHRHQPGLPGAGAPAAAGYPGGEHPL